MGEGWPSRSPRSRIPTDEGRVPNTRPFGCTRHRTGPRSVYGRISSEIKMHTHPLLAFFLRILCFCFVLVWSVLPEGVLLDKLLPVAVPLLLLLIATPAAPPEGTSASGNVAGRGRGRRRRPRRQAPRSTAAAEWRVWPTRRRWWASPPCRRAPATFRRCGGSATVTRAPVSPPRRGGGGRRRRARRTPCLLEAPL